MLNDVSAVIVTYNRAGKLKKVLDALAAQTVPLERIFVIDNASTDNTGELVEDYAAGLPALRYIRLPRNLGGAGGFHEGMKVAYADGANYLWISDDDAYPRPDAIEKLLEAIVRFENDNGYKPSFACSRVEWTDGAICEMNIPNPVWDWARFIDGETSYPLVNSCSFVSVLVPRWAVREHGLPIAEYFIWFDDAEYTRRLSRSYPGIFCPESRVIHDIPENKGVNYGLVTEKSLWKFKYGARNEASFHRRERGVYGVLAFFYHVRSEMRQGGVPLKLRRQIYRAILRGLSFRPKIERV